MVSAYCVSGPGCNVLHAWSHFCSQWSHEENTIISISQKRKMRQSQNNTASKWQGLDQNPSQSNCRFQVLNHWTLPLSIGTQSVPLLNSYLLECSFTKLHQLDTLLLLLIIFILEESSVSLFMLLYLMTLWRSQNHFWTPCYFGQLLLD